MTTARRRGRSSKADTGSSGDGGVTDFRADLWRMADTLRGSMDAAEYKHVVLGLIFLKYISDAFEEAHAQLEAEVDQGADPEDPDEYIAENIFWVPPEARWPHLQSQAHQPTIGRTVDDAMVAIERDNSALKDVLPKDYARPALDKTRLGQVVDMVSNIKLGGAEARATDVLGSVYEYFLEQFALAEGRVKGGVIMYRRGGGELLMASINVLPNRPARMSHYGECDIDSKGAGKVTGPQQLTGRAHGSGSGGHVDGSERTPHQAHPGGLQQGGSSRTRSRSSWTPSTQRDTRAAKVRGPASCWIPLPGNHPHSPERAAQGA